MFGFNGKVAIVTGAASGIGRSSALLYAREGAKVAVSDVDETGGLKTVAVIGADGGEAFFVQADVFQTRRIVKLWSERRLRNMAALIMPVTTPALGVNKT